MSGRISRIIREIMYAAASVRAMNGGKASKMESKMESEIEYKMDFTMVFQMVFKMEFEMVLTMVFQMVFKMEFEIKFVIEFEMGLEMESLTHSAIRLRNTGSKGPPVIKIAETLQSHFSAAVGNVNDQGMKWMAPKRATTLIMAQIEGPDLRTFFSSEGE